jgi:hypothetical protein
MRFGLRNRRRPFGLLLLGLLASCTYWRTEPPAGAAAVVTEARPRTVRVSKADGSRMELRGARIANDTLTGVAETGDTVRIVLAEVMQLERRATDTFRTAMIGALMFSTVFVASAIDFDIGLGSE